MAGSSEPEQIAIVLHSGSYDRAIYVLALATTALAMGAEVRILLTFGGLRRFTRGHLEELGEETPAELRPALERGLASGGIAPLGQALINARALGLKLYACGNAMASLNITRDELVEGVDGVTTLSAFLGFARTATVNWYV